MLFQRTTYSSAYSVLLFFMHTQNVWSNEMLTFLFIPSVCQLFGSKCNAVGNICAIWRSPFFSLQIITRTDTFSMENVICFSTFILFRVFFPFLWVCWFSWLYCVFWLNRHEWNWPFCCYIGVIVICLSFSTFKLIIF